MDTWDHDFVRTGHSAHMCGICGVHNGYHGGKGEPRAEQIHAEQAPVVEPRKEWTGPWPGYEMVNLSEVRQCPVCLALVIDQEGHTRLAHPEEP